MKKWLKLEQVFNMEQWNILQKSLAQVTGLAIITVDYKGVPVTEHSGCNEFCRKIRQDEVLCEFCQKCDSRGGLESIRTNQPYIYQCCFSIIDIAIPIIVDNVYLGAIMAGQVRLPQDQSNEMLEKIYLPSSSNEALVRQKIAELEQEYSTIPFLSYERIETAARMLFHLCNYLVREVDIKNQTISMVEEILLKQDLTSSKVSMEEIEAISPAPKQKNIMISSPEGSAAKQEIQKRIKSSNRIIQKSFDYLCANKKETISLKRMSDHCFVSAGYLSRLFTKEIGESYSTFVIKLKIEWAKELLETTDSAVSQISEELGFNDVSYFIRAFKKNVGLTPAFYRSYINR